MTAKKLEHGFFLLGPGKPWAFFDSPTRLPDCREQAYSYTC
ncbi:hypothetical protein [Methanosarcina acetivorans]|nr:hypothetical protein [Methanosarcina acetivorans]